MVSVSRRVLAAPAADNWSAPHRGKPSTISVPAQPGPAIDPPLLYPEYVVDRSRAPSRTFGIIPAG